jgi:hypothetical protein
VCSTQISSCASTNDPLGIYVQERPLPSAFCLFLAGLSVDAAQEKPNKDASEDKPLFLVARPEMGDPIFKESVVLMLPSSVGAEKGPVVGLIVNRPARVALSTVFPDDKALKDRSETAYFGGPVAPRAPGVVFRSTKAVKQATLLFGDGLREFRSGFHQGTFEETGENA